MKPLTIPQLLEKFMALANAKGADFSHFTTTPRQRIRVHYHPSKRRRYNARNFLNYGEALEHIYVAYNLKDQYYFKPVETKRFDLDKNHHDAREETFRELMAELYPEKY